MSQATSINVKPMRSNHCNYCQCNTPVNVTEIVVSTMYLRSIIHHKCNHTQSNNCILNTFNVIIPVHFLHYVAP